MNFFTRLICTVLALSAGLPLTEARAAKFGNQFTEFELPPGWGCQLEGAEWVCQNVDESKKKEAIIVLAAKLKGEQDSLDQYLSYLKATKSFSSVDNKPMKSEPKYAKFVVLNGQNWVDSLHMESEIPGFYTRYLATVKDDIGVLITYSIAKAKYQEYINDFEAMVKTLKVFRKEGAINTGSPTASNFEAVSTVTEDRVFPGVNISGGSDQPTKPKEEGGMDIMTIAMIAAGAAAVAIVLKKRKG